MPIRIQRKRTKGWRKPEGVVSVTRPGKYGNPFVAGSKVPDEWIEKLDKDDYFHFIRFECGYVDTAEQAIFLFEKYVLPDLDLLELAGKDVMCFCALNKPCHGDSILKAANS